jgi:hypothetical protein
MASAILANITTLNEAQVVLITHATAEELLGDGDITFADIAEVVLSLKQSLPERDFDADTLSTGALFFVSAIDDRIKAAERHIAAGGAFETKEDLYEAYANWLFATTTPTDLAQRGGVLTPNSLAKISATVCTDLLADGQVTVKDIFDLMQAAVTYPFNYEGLSAGGKLIWDCIVAGALNLENGEEEGEDVTAEESEQEQEQGFEQEPESSSESGSETTETEAVEEEEKDVEQDVESVDGTVSSDSFEAVRELLTKLGFEVTVVK